MASSKKYIIRVPVCALTEYLEIQYILITCRSVSDFVFLPHISCVHVATNMREVVVTRYNMQSANRICPC